MFFLIVVIESFKEYIDLVGLYMLRTSYSYEEIVVLDGYKTLVVHI